VCLIHYRCSRGWNCCALRYTPVPRWYTLREYEICELQSLSNALLLLRYYRASNCLLLLARRLIGTQHYSDIFRYLRSLEFITRNNLHILILIKTYTIKMHFFVFIIIHWENCVIHWLDYRNFMSVILSIISRYHALQRALLPAFVCRGQSVKLRGRYLETGS